MKLTTSALALTIGLSGLAVATSAQAAPLETVATVDADVDGIDSLDTAATADAHVDAAYASSNRGDTDILLVDGREESTKHAFLKFTVPTVSSGETIDTVSLRLDPRLSSDQGIVVRRTGNGWAEDTLTWMNQPGEGTLLGFSNALRAGITEDIDLDPSEILPGQVVSLRIDTWADAQLPFVSSEAWGSAGPILRVTTTTDADPGTPPAPGETPVTDDSWPPVEPVARKIIGMSAPDHLWDARIDEVGADGVNARRIFADLSASGSSQLPLIREAVDAGMTPLISYKVPDAATLAAGGYDAWLATLRTQLNALDVPVTATFWHEPHGDLDPALFRRASLKFFDAVDSPDIAVGPILNGWLLDSRTVDFASYTDHTLLTKWEFVGVDTYQRGGVDAPSSTRLPGRAVPLLAAWLDTQGFDDKKIVVGEYNGFTAPAVAQAGEWILSTPEVWIGSMWNSVVPDGSGLGLPLSGDRLTAFQDTKEDTRAMP